MAQEEIEKKIEDFLQSLTPDDRGLFYTELFSAYIEASNKINSKYEKELQDISQSLAVIKQKEDASKREELIKETEMIGY